MGLCALVVGCSTPHQGAPPQQAGRATPLPYHGVEPTERTPRPSFTLTDLTGQSFDFAAQTKGRPTYLYFGYTHCPDECPTAMADMVAALRLAAEVDRQRAVVVFVTTDPARDSAPVLRRFLQQFGWPIVGLRGTKAEIDGAQDAVGIPLAQPEGPIPTVSGDPSQHTHKPGTSPHQHFGPLGYGVAHANLIFAFDTEDTMPVAYPGGVTPSDIAKDLPLLLGRGANPTPS